MKLITGAELDLPTYDPVSRERCPKTRRLLTEIRAAQGLIIASPGYHGSVSGMVKNALDYIEDLRNETRCYLSDVPVGCIVSAAGWQACGSTLAALRAIVHALRGWPTPLGVTFNSTAVNFSAQGVCVDTALRQSLSELTRQVIQLARMQIATPATCS